MNVDLITAVLCLLMGLAFFVLNVTSSPRNSLWRDFPSFLRLGFFLTGTGFICRGVNLFDLSAHPPVGVGSINGPGFVLTGLLAYTIIGLTLYTLRQTGACRRAWRWTPQRGQPPKPPA